MRLWSLHPEYLDSKGIVALWREGLLARNVLELKTKGYKYHPQLDRFKTHPHPVMAINFYLECVYQKALRRGFHFDQNKLIATFSCPKIKVTDGQLKYEWKHLKTKLLLRDVTCHERLKGIAIPQPHPLFEVIPGDMEPWERNRIIM